MNNDDKEELKKAVVSVLIIFGLVFIGALMLMGLILIGKGLGIITK